MRSIGDYILFAMLRQIVTRLKQLAVKTTRLARNCTDKTTAAELEGLAVELAEEASRLDQLSNIEER